MIVPSLNGNYIDLLILMVMGIWVVDGTSRGFWSLVFQLASFVGSFVLGFRFYKFAGQFLIDNFSLPHSFANALGFILVVILLQIIIGIFLGRFLEKIPKKVLSSRFLQAASFVPALLDCVIAISIFLTVFMSLPVLPNIKQDVSDSKIGGYLVTRTARFESQLNEVFGGAIRESMNFLTVKPESGEKVNIPYKPKKLTVDAAVEARMLELVSSERAKAGVKPLKIDTTIVVVARAHSKDMWERGYFSHTNPDGLSPFDRMEKGGVKFLTAGENLALAPTTETAHQGLMNSPGHRRNILDPSFGRVGIGVIDGGIYGKMYTQNFAD